MSQQKDNVQARTQIEKRPCPDSYQGSIVNRFEIHRAFIQELECKKYKVLMHHSAKKPQKTPLLITCI